MIPSRNPLRQHLGLTVSLQPLRGFPDSSVGKQSACNAGDPGFDSWEGRSTGEGIDYPLQYSWASIVAQLVKNRPVMQETWVQSLGWEDPLEKGKATHSSILAWRIAWSHGVTKSQTWLSDFHFISFHFTSLTASERKGGQDRDSFLLFSRSVVSDSLPPHRL